MRSGSVCKLLRKSLLLAGKWPYRHQTCTRWTPGKRASRVCSRSRSRSKVTLYGHFCAGTKIASCREQMAGSPPNLHTMDSRSACIQSMLKVKVKGHVIRALLCWHENRFFSRAKGGIATKLAHDGLQVSVHPGCSQGQGQYQRSRDTGTIVLARKSLFSLSNCSIATKLAVDGLQESVAQILSSPISGERLFVGSRR